MPSNYDIEVVINAPIERVFHIIRHWYTLEELRRFSSVKAFNSLGTGSGYDYFKLAVKELPLKTTFCYGKRLFREPFTLISMFIYRFFKSADLNSAERVEEALNTSWDDFFYQTTRLYPLENGMTRLQFLDSFGMHSKKKQAHFEAYFELIKELTETELVATGVDVVAEPVDDEVFPDDDLADDEGDFEKQRTMTFDIYDDYDPYSVLGVSRDSRLSDIKQAYRQKAKQYHPDAQQYDYGHSQFVEITAAYHAILRERE